MSHEAPSYEGQILPLKETPEEETRRKLVEQFEQPEKVDLYDGAETLSIRDVQPKEPKTKTSVLWAKGWGSTIENNYRANFLGLAEKGRRVLGVDNVYGISSKREEGVDLAREIVPDELMLDKVVALLKTIEVKKLDKVDVVAHSEGAILQPEKFRSLVLVDPAGMIGESTPSRVIQGAAIDVGVQMWKMVKNRGLSGLKKHMTGPDMGAGKAIAVNPIKAVKSIGLISKTQIHELISAVREGGVKVSIIHGVDDKFFTMEDVQQMTKAGTVDGFYSVKMRDNDEPSGHNLLITKPDEFNKIIDSALDALEKLHEKESQKGDGQ